MRPSIPHLQVSLRAKSTSFIGLGRMGYEMAFNLFSKQFAEAPESRFVVCDVTPESTSLFVRNLLQNIPGANVTVAPSPAEATVASRTVVTMLPSSPQVKVVYTGPSGILQALSTLTTSMVQSTLCIDSTTLDVDIAKEVASEVISSGAKMIDAPVSGGVAGAKAGTLSFLVGGSEAAFKASHPILSQMGKRIIHCGASGAGLGAKICNNLVLGVQQIAVAEAMLLGEALELESAVLASVINSSTGACWASSVNNPVPSALPDKSPPCERDYEGGFATSLMLKDMILATNIGKRTRSPLPIGQAAENLYGEVINKDATYARKDFSSVYRFLRQLPKPIL